MRPPAEISAIFLFQFFSVMRPPAEISAIFGSKFIVNFGYCRNPAVCYWYSAVSVGPAPVVGSPTSVALISSPIQAYKGEKV